MELIVRKFGIGKLIFKDGYYLDQLSLDYVWIYKSYFRGYLLNTYGLTFDKYYNLVVFGNIKIVPRCCICGCKKVAWNAHDRLLEGYKLTCSESCNNLLNSKLVKSNKVSKSFEFLSTASKLSHANMTDDQKLVRSSKLSDSLKLYWNNLSLKDRQDKLDYLHKCSREYIRLNGNTSAFKNFEVLSKCHKNRFLNLGKDSDLCEFYIATTNDKEFKFGITEDLSNRTWSNEYINSRILFRMNRINIAEFEYQIKLELKSGSEHMDFKNVKNFIMAYSKVRKLFESTGIKFYSIK